MPGLQAFQAGLLQEPQAGDGRPHAQSCAQPEASADSTSQVCCESLSNAGYVAYNECTMKLGSWVRTHAQAHAKHQQILIGCLPGMQEE